MALQYACRMGFKVVAVGGGEDIAREGAIELGAHLHVDTGQDNAAARLKRLGGAAAVTATGAGE